MSEEIRIFLSKLVLHGESILAETFRLSSFVPKEFHDDAATKSRKAAKFRRLVQLDFKYFAKSAQIEKELENDLPLQSQFYAHFEPVLIAFEQLFGSIAEFVQTLQSYARESDADERLETSRIDELETYCVYIAGLLVIYLDTFVAGPVRERLYVAIYRKSDVRENAEFLVDFLKDTRSNRGDMRRLQLPKSFVGSCLRSVETREESSLKFSKAQLMYVVSAFDPTVLTSDSARMTRIANSIYRDSWVVNLGFGVIVNIFDAWYPFKSAWNALNATISQQTAVDLMERHARTMRETNFPQVITEMADFSSHLQSVSSANRSLRWLYLHCRPTSSSSRGGRVLKEPPSEATLFQWLLDVSRCESLLLNLYTSTLENRDAQVDGLKTSLRARLQQLADFFEHGLVKMSEAQKVNFVKWVRNLMDTVTRIDSKQSEEGAETVQQIVRRIKQVGDLLGLSMNVTLKECLSGVDAELRALLSVLSLSDRLVSDVYSRMDSSYLWPLLRHLIPRIQQNLVSTANSDVVRHVFTKLSVSTWILKTKLSEFAERDQIASRIVNTYSYSLEKHLRTVLQSVPQHLFAIMFDVIQPALSRKFQPYIEKTELRELSDFIHDSKLVESTCLIANTSLGISRMMLTRLGTIEINPKQLLEDGMIRQLYKEIKKVMSAPTACTSIETLLKTCSSVETLRSSFFYLCDYMNLDGERVWSVAVDDFFSRISEEHAFAKSSGDLERNEMFELVVRVTNPKTTRYSEHTLSWLDAKKSKKVLSFDVLFKIEKMLPFHVLTSIETNVTVQLERILIEYVSSARKLGVSFNLQNAVSHATASDFFAGADYERLVKSVQSSAVALATLLAQIGQHVLILRMIVDSKRLANRQKEDSVQRDLILFSRSLSSEPTDLPTEMGTILKLMMQYSLYKPERMLFRLKDEPSPIFMLALVQCVLPKIGDASFVCPVQLETGIRFVLRQSRLLPYFLPMLLDQLPHFQRPKKRTSDVEQFLSRLSNNLT